ncbi:MAG: hypothetical protein MUF49_23100 [Oculatellaceae cyanobacterium Prado106]|jgi:hypothetical protein|nr:hypothetical protein [Oculatellaceae cyanobacterium Prado106]
MLHNLEPHIEQPLSVTPFPGAPNATDHRVEISLIAALLLLTPFVIALSSSLYKSYTLHRHDRQLERQREMLERIWLSGTIRKK